MACEGRRHGVRRENMKTITRIAIPLFAAFAASVAFGEKLPFDRYQSVVDRMPFGQPPPGFDPFVRPSEAAATAAAAEGPELTADQQQLQKAVSFSVINVESDGTVKVGFIDNSDAKSPKCYYMAVGEQRDGWLVKEGDPSKKTMTVEKDGVEVSLDLGAKSAASPGKPAVGGRTARAMAAARPGVATGGGTPPMSIRGRRAAREAEERAAAEARAKEAAAREAERSAREAERNEREAAEKAERDAEREAQREQLRKIQEELKRAREERAAREKESAESEGNENDHP